MENHVAGPCEKASLICAIIHSDLDRHHHQAKGRPISSQARAMVAKHALPEAYVNPHSVWSSPYLILCLNSGNCCLPARVEVRLFHRDLAPLTSPERNCGRPRRQPWPCRFKNNSKQLRVPAPQLYGHPFIDPPKWQSIQYVFLEKKIQPTMNGRSEGRPFALCNTYIYLNIHMNIYMFMWEVQIPLVTMWE